MRFLVFCTICIWLAHSTVADECFTPLFDGKTFTGWEGNRGVFRIEGGAIVGGSLKASVAHNEYLCTIRSYRNFELRLKFKLLGENVNGGVQFRSERVPKSNEMIGYQADMGQQYWGCLYDERRHKQLTGPTKEQQQKLIRHNDWNDYVIRAEGRHVQLWLNGQKTVDYTEPDASIPQEGVFGLQIHQGTPSEAWYKDITIRGGKRGRNLFRGEERVTEKSCVPFCFADWKIASHFVNMGELFLPGVCPSRVQIKYRLKGPVMGTAVSRRFVWRLCVALLAGFLPASDSHAAAWDPGAADYAGHKGKTLYVSKLGDNSNGGSWQTAYRTIQAALLAIADDRGGHRVVIRPDTYVEANLYTLRKGARGLTTC